MEGSPIAPDSLGSLLARPVPGVNRQPEAQLRGEHERTSHGPQLARQFANRFGVRALAHGCNCQGSMGAGIATGFRDRYPAMHAEYRRRCKAEPRAFNLGDAWLWKSDDRPWVFNLGTQEGVWRARASYQAIEAALRSMRQQAAREGITTLAVPRIGAGYGGLSWAKVRAVVEQVFADWPGTLYVYEEYHPEAAEEDVRASGKSAAPIRDVRREPLKVLGYAIGVREGRVSVRIERDE